MNRYNEIIKALQTIKDTCEDNFDCYECQLGDGDGTCRIMEDVPDTWDIESEPIPVVRLLK